MRCGVAWQITFVHADTTGDSHEKRHRRAFENCTWRFWIFAYLYVFMDDIARGVYVVPVQVGCMVWIFLNDLIISDWRVMALAPGRYL